MTLLSHYLLVCIKVLWLQTMKFVFQLGILEDCFAISLGVFITPICSFTLLSLLSTSLRSRSEYHSKTYCFFLRLYFHRYISITFHFIVMLLLPSIIQTTISSNHFEKSDKECILFCCSSDRSLCQMIYTYIFFIL